MLDVEGQDRLTFSHLLSIFLLEKPHIFQIRKSRLPSRKTVDGPEKVAKDPEKNGYLTATKWSKGPILAVA